MIDTFKTMAVGPPGLTQRLNRIDYALRMERQGWGDQRNPNIVASARSALHIGRVQDLHSGAIVGHYKLVRYLGKGGMGIVYESEDLKLGRRVALKFLSEATLNEPATLDRFWREARTASALNHPAICTVHELNESTDPPFLVMELLDGQSLDKLCSGNSIPSSRLIKIAIQIADGLSSAHRQGILHRDIKPSNIVVSDSGQAKLLDFGLAKRVEIDSDQTTLSLHHLVTNPGYGLGTLAYMSPEQARGEQLDSRTDIFSFGIVLYQMATGCNPFMDANPAIVIDRLLHQSPIPPRSLNPAVSADLERIIHKALEKDRDFRYQSAADLLADMKKMQQQSDNSSHKPYLQANTSDSKPHSKSTRVWIILAVLVVCLAAGLSWYLRPRPPAFSSISVVQITDSGDITDIALFPDARMLAEVKSDGRQYTLWIRNIPTNTDTQILPPTSLPYTGLTVSPDGNQLYFNRKDADHPEYSSLYAVSVLGGRPRRLVYDIDGPVGFSPDGKNIVYVRRAKPDNFSSSELHVANKDGGDDQVLSKNPGMNSSPAYSPDGSEVAWVQLEGQRASIERPALILLHLKSKHQERISLPQFVFFISKLAWLPDGKHLLLNGDFLNANHSNIGQLAEITVPSGAFRRVTNDLANYHRLTLSDDGHTVATLIYGVATRVDYSRSSDGIPLTSKSFSHSLLGFSWVDEKQIVFIEVSGGRPGISMLERETGQTDPIEIGKSASVYPDGVASCLGDQLVFTGNSPEHRIVQLYRIKSDGTGLTPLVGTDGASTPFCAPHSRFVSYTTGASDKATGWAIPLEGGTPLKIMDLPLLPTVNYIVTGKTAAYLFQSTSNAPHQSVLVKDLATQKTLRRFELKDYAAGSTMYFSRDNKAVVYVENRGQDFALIYQPIDGTRPQTIAQLGHERVIDFAWSPSGKELAVLRWITTSDIALISDTTHKLGR